MVQTVRIAGVKDPCDVAKSVDIKIPPEYIKNATELIQTKAYKPKLKEGKPVEYFTYFFFDPARPATVIDELPYRQKPLR